MQKLYIPYSHVLKPMRIATNKQLVASKNIQKLLKRYVATIALKPAARRRTTPQDQPRR